MIYLYYCVRLRIDQTDKHLEGHRSKSERTNPVSANPCMFYLFMKHDNRQILTTPKVNRCFRDVVLAEVVEVVENSLDYKKKTNQSIKTELNIKRCVLPPAPPEDNAVYFIHIMRRGDYNLEKLIWLEKADGNRSEPNADEMDCLITWSSLRDTIRTRDRRP